MNNKNFLNLIYGIGFFTLCIIILNISSVFLEKKNQSILAKNIVKNIFHTQTASITKIKISDNNFMKVNKDDNNLGYIKIFSFLIEKNIVNGWVALDKSLTIIGFGINYWENNANLIHLLDQEELHSLVLQSINIADPFVLNKVYQTWVNLSNYNSEVMVPIFKKLFPIQESLSILTTQITKNIQKVLQLNYELDGI